MAEARSDAILWDCVALKKELKSLSKSIVDGEDTSIQETNSCIGVLSSLISLKAGKYVGYGVHWRDVPQQFRCPLSGNIMTDPVLLSSGQDMYTHHGTKASHTVSSVTFSYSNYTLYLRSLLH